MNEEELKKLWYYVIRVEDNDRYLWEVYANDDLLYIETTREKAYEKLYKLAEFIQS